MTEKEKAASDVATIGSGTEEQKREQAIILPNKKYIMQSERLQGRTKRKGDIVGERPGLIPDGYGDVTAGDNVSQDQKRINNRDGLSFLCASSAVRRQLAKLARAADEHNRLAIMFHPVKRGLKEKEADKHGEEKNVLA